MIDPQAAITAVIRLLAFGTVLSSAEYLWHRDILKPAGLMSWDVGRLRQKWLLKGATGSLFNSALSYPHILWLLALRIILALMMLVGSAELASAGWIVLFSALLSWLFVLRTSYGLDGADQLACIIYAGLAVETIVGTNQGREAFLWFISLEACLAYTVAGVAKASTKGWRDGSYLRGIFATKSYGNVAVANLLSQSAWLSLVISWIVISWESLFLIVLLAPKSLAVAILISGVLFHLLNGYAMGLNTFFWFFAATYPAILHCSGALKLLFKQS